MDSRANPRPPDGARRPDAQPDAAAARAARADRVGALRRPAAAAVDRQPPSEGAGRRRLGCVAARGHEPLLHDDARRARRRRPAGCGCWSASRSAPTPAPTRMQRRLQSVLAERRIEVAGVLRVVGRPVGSAARRAVRRSLPPRGAAGAARPSVDRRRSRLRHRPGQRRARAVRRARDRGRRLGGDAAGGAAAAARRSTTSISGAASSRRCRSTMRGSMRRC